MNWVNFLPWRQERLRIQGYRWALALLLVLSLLAVMLLVWAGQHHLNKQTLKLLMREKETYNEIVRLNARLAVLGQQREHLKRQLTARQSQQQQLRQWYEFSRRLPEMMPSTLWLSDISKTPESLTITGFCQKIRDVNDFRHRLTNQSLFRKVVAGRIEREQQGWLTFSLQIALNGEGRDE